MQVSLNSPKYSGQVTSPSLPSITHTIPPLLGSIFIVWLPGYMFVFLFVCLHMPTGIILLLLDTMNYENLLYRVKVNIKDPKEDCCGCCIVKCAPNAWYFNTVITMLSSVDSRYCWTLILHQIKPFTNLLLQFLFKISL